jgi:hypothetical protein
MENRINTHNLSGKGWGKSYEVMKLSEDGHKASLAGWSLGVKSGDYLILQSPEGTTRYQVDSIEYCRDPHDMWFAEASFSPRDN